MAHKAAARQHLSSRSIPRGIPLRPPAPPPPIGGLRGARGWSGGRTIRRSPRKPSVEPAPDSVTNRPTEHAQAEPLPNEHGGRMPWRFPLPAAVWLPMFPPVG